MESYLWYRLTYTFHRLGFYYYSVKYYLEDHYEKGLFDFLKLFLMALIDKIKIFSKDSGYYEYIEIPITTRCTMKCKACSNLIPYYGSPCDIAKEKLLGAIDVLIRCISNIVYIRILGGEPFLSKDLVPVLRKLIKCKKIQRIEIVTNGTIIPQNKELIDILKNPRVMVSISEYPNVDYAKLIVFLSKLQIKYRVDKMNFWMEYGTAEKRNKSQKELKKQFKKCKHVCKSLLNGQLHLCPRSSHGTDLKLITNNQNDYVDLLDTSTTIEEKKKAIVTLFQKDYIEACDYCSFATKESKKIPVAEQVS